MAGLTGASLLVLVLIVLLLPLGLAPFRQPGLATALTNFTSNALTVHMDSASNSKAYVQRLMMCCCAVVLVLV